MAQPNQSVPSGGTFDFTPDAGTLASATLYLAGGPVAPSPRVGSVSAGSASWSLAGVPDGYYSGWVEYATDLGDFAFDVLLTLGTPGSGVMAPPRPLTGLSYPSGGDLYNFFGILQAAITNAAYLDFDGRVAAAVAEWEARTGFLPFVSSGTPETRVFDGQWDNVIRFAGGLVSLSSNGVTINGAIYSSTFYALKPNNAELLGRPYRSVKFGRLQEGWLPVVNGPAEDGITYLGGAQRVIGITGLWGYCLPGDLPADVRNAILCRAASLCVPQLALAISKGIFSARDLNFEVRFEGGSSGPVIREAAAWDKTFEDAVTRPQYRANVYF